MKTYFEIKSTNDALRFAAAVSKLNHSPAVNEVALRFADCCAQYLDAANAAAGRPDFKEEDKLDAAILIINRIAAIETDEFDVVFDPYQGFFNVDEMTAAQALDAGSNFATRLTIRAGVAAATQFNQASGNSRRLIEIADEAK